MNDLKATTAREYRRKHGADMPTLKLARIMYNETQPLFKHVEDARERLRYIEGKAGKRMKGQLGTKAEGFVMEEARPRNPYSLPESDEIDFKPHVIKGYKRIALLSDIHIPYHSVSSITVALDFLRKEKPDLLLLNGDLLDFYQLSRFGKDPRKRDFAYELDTLGKMIDIFRKTLKCEILYKMGNHEVRYQHFLAAKAHELIGVKEFDLENIIKARAGEITVVGDKTIMHANKLNIIHGHEFSQGFFSPVNVARGLALRAKASAIQGHNHQSSSHNSVDINGKVMTTWSVGCLAELHPEYAPINNWNHGFAVIDLDAKGDEFEVRNKTIVKGKIY